MTQSFDDFYEENKDVFDPCVWRSAEKAFKAGAQSKQAEIDELIKHKEILLGELFLVSDAIQYHRVLNLLKGTTNE